MIAIFTGLPGAGKSLKMSATFVELLYRNKKIKEKYGFDRKIYSNLHLSKEVEEEFPGQFVYWTDPSELVKVRNADVMWDEIATYLDSTQWQNMSLEIKRWLQQHRKFGIEIYGTTQDFAMIDKSMRRMTSDLKHLTKMFGSRDISSTKPPVKYVWGLIMVQTFDPTTYDEETKKALGFPSFMLISRSSVNVFDTTQEIVAGKYPPLNHIERECLHPDCQHGLKTQVGHSKIIHA